MEPFSLRSVRFNGQGGLNGLDRQGLVSQDGRSFSEDFALRVAEVRGSLSSNDERVIEQLRDSPEKLAFHTSDSLAQSVGVSRAAVVRFARKLGFAGFTELRDAARGAVQEQRESPLGRFADEAPASLMARKLQQDIANLGATRTLAEAAVPAAARAIARARAVYVVGSRKSHGIAMYAQRLLRGVRPNVVLVDPAFPDDIAGLSQADAVIGCLFRRYSPQTIALLNAARAAKACTVVITDGRGHDFAADADHVLAALADTPTIYDSMVAPIWLLEVLVAETAAVDRQRSRQTLEEIERFTEDHGLLLD